MSLIDVGYLIASTIISVVAHEFGHAVAAARSVLVSFVDVFVIALLKFLLHNSNVRLNI